MNARVLRLILISLSLALAACSGDATRKSAHARSAPHGGTIIRLGKEEFHLEFVRDATTGRLTAYVLDELARLPVSARSSSFELVATVAGEKRTLQFEPVTGTAAESFDRAQYVAQADWLKTTPQFEGVLPLLKIENTTYLRVPVKFPAGDE